MSSQTPPAPRGHRVREFVGAYRTLRNEHGQPVRLSTLALSEPRIAAAALAPLLEHEAVEIFGVACLSTRHRLLAWHVLSRGTRSGTSVSLPDVFVPACLTPRTTALLVAHNHPSGDPAPSADDARLTDRLAHAADVIDIPLLDHVIVGATDATTASARPVCSRHEARGSRASESAPSIAPWMVGRSSGSSSLSRRSTPDGAAGLDGPSGPPRLSTYGMAGLL